MEFKDFIAKYFNKVNPATGLTFSQLDVKNEHPEVDLNVIALMWTFALGVIRGTYEKEKRIPNDAEVIDAWDLLHPQSTQAPPPGYKWGPFGWIPDNDPIGATSKAQFWDTLKKVVAR